MTISSTDPQAEGRRRSDTAGIGRAPTGFDHVGDVAGKAPGPVATAFAELSDRHLRLEHNLTALNTAVEVLTKRLEPVLTDGQPISYPEDPGTQPATPAPVDTRSMVARSISAEARIADTHSDFLAKLVGDLERLTEAVEV